MTEHQGDFDIHLGGVELIHSHGMTGYFDGDKLIGVEWETVPAGRTWITTRTIVLGSPPRRWRRLVHPGRFLARWLRWFVAWPDSVRDQEGPPSWR